MITIDTGRIFLKEYNKKYNTSLTPKEFFVDVMWYVFFNHPKLLLWVQNTPLVQMKKGQKVYNINEDERKEKLNTLISEIESGRINMSTAIGFQADESKEFRSTSGLISDIDIAISENDVYLSWIGYGLMVGINGGWTILVNNPTILMHIFDGWYEYRKLLNNDSLGNMLPNKLSTWNGQWLSYKLGKDYIEDWNYSYLSDLGIFDVTKDGISINTVSWSKLLFRVSSVISTDIINVIVGKLGQTNETIGYIPFKISTARKLKLYYKKLFGNIVTENGSISTLSDYEHLFGGHFESAVKNGQIGMTELMPTDLIQYFKKDKMNFKSMTETQLQIYKTWLFTMMENPIITNEKLTELSNVLIEYVTADKKLSTKRKNMVENLLVSKNVLTFVEALIDMIDSDEFSDSIYEFKNLIVAMNKDEFKYFITLLKFEYKFLINKK